MTCNMVSVLRHEAALDLLPAGHSIVTETMFFWDSFWDSGETYQLCKQVWQSVMYRLLFRPGLKVAVVVSCTTLVDLTHRFIISVHPALKYKYSTLLQCAATCSVLSSDFHH